MNVQAKAAIETMAGSKNAGTAYAARKHANLKMAADSKSNAKAKEKHRNDAERKCHEAHDNKIKERAQVRASCRAATTAPTASSLDLIIRTPKVTTTTDSVSASCSSGRIAVDAEPIVHTWTQTGPLGIKLKPMSTTSLDTEEGVFCDSATGQSVPKEIVNCIITDIKTCKSGGETKHVALENQSYNHILGILKGSPERPLEITFRRLF